MYNILRFIYQSTCNVNYARVLTRHKKAYCIKHPKGRRCHTECIALAYTYYVRAVPVCEDA